MAHSTSSAVWDKRALDTDLHAVFTKRWSKEECRAVHDAQAAIMLTLLNPGERESVLDLGCGIGRLTRLLAQHAGAVIGLDISTGMLGRAAEAMPQGWFIAASAQSLPFPNGTFDAICASFVFQHLLDDRTFFAALAECRRILKPGGRMAMMEGIGDTSYRPANSAVTVVRTLDQFRSALGPHTRLVARENHVLIEDHYTALLWRVADREAEHS